MRLYRWLALAAAMLIAGDATAATVTLGATNTFGQTSFNTALSWSNAAAPSAGNDYQNAGFLLRTPDATPNSFTFAGDSLLITGPGLVTAAANDALMWKGNGTTAVITVNNLTINGGQLRQAQGDNDTVTWAGTLAIGPNGANMATQGGMIVSSPISGSSTLRILPSGSNGVNRVITISSGANTFTGNINMVNATQSRLTLADNANLNFVIGASGVNNTISGLGILNLNGDFNIDLSGAGTTTGDSWTLVSGPTTTYGATFSIPGFTNPVPGKWRSGLYKFDQATGVLSVTPVPEPAGVALVGLALAGAAAASRKRRMG
jgi:hypothetical protein